VKASGELQFDIRPPFQGGAADGGAPPRAEAWLKPWAVSVFPLRGKDSSITPCSCKTALLSYFLFFTMLPAAGH
jgi:hypothetical protein